GHIGRRHPSDLEDGKSVPCLPAICRWFLCSPNVLPVLVDRHEYRGERGELHVAALRDDVQQFELLFILGCYCLHVPNKWHAKLSEWLCDIAMRIGGRG